MADGGNVVPRITKAEHVGPNDTGDNVEAKRVVPYTWDSANLQWQRSDGQPAPTDTIVDGDTNPPMTYIGKSYLGADESDPVWQIKRLDASGGANSVEIRYAEASAAYSHTWANRATLTYN